MKLSAGNDFRRKANQVFKWLMIATEFINLVAERSRPAAKSSSARRDLPKSPTAPWHTP
jgi:hypothetical protein